MVSMNDNRNKTYNTEPYCLASIFNKSGSVVFSHAYMKPFTYYVIIYDDESSLTIGGIRK